jgi:2-hydroxy-6-oxonona-2,4-dienedioate hydrolase
MPATQAPSTGAELTHENTRRLVRTGGHVVQINEAGEGHPVFFLHGSGPGASGWSNFAPNIRALADRFRCIAVTMPGWGESSERTVEKGLAQAPVMNGLMDELGIEKAAFVGNSGGGGTALIMAGLHPERVSHLITMGSGIWGPSLLTPGGLSEGLRALVAAYEDPSDARFREMVRVMCYDPAFATEELVAERAAAARAHPHHLRNWLEVMRAGAGAEELLAAAQALPRSSVPALLVHGRDDRTVHFEFSLRTLGVLPSSRLVLLNRCGHWAQLEHPDEFNRLVTDFLLNN